MCRITIDGISPFASSEVGKYLTKTLSYTLINKRPIIFLCIGSDRATGDSLGPLIGYKLKNSSKNNIYIYGSLENPIHSLNLSTILDKINSNFTNPFIVAIDACLGTVQDVGKIIIEDAPLCPGLGVKKELPSVGDVSIKGVVNIYGSLEFTVLQNTRLYTVMSLADSISNGINYFINKFCNNKFSLKH